MHRLFPEFGDEHYGEQVQIAVDEAVETEFGGAVLAFPVLDHLFPNFGEAFPFGDNRNVAVHFTVHLDVFHHLLAVGLESAVEIVQLDFRHAACGPVEELGGDVFGQFGVIAYLFPAGNQVVALFRDFPVEFRNLIGAVLQVGVHGDYHIALRGFKTHVQSGRFSVVPLETDAVNLSVGLLQLLDYLPGIVGAAIVHEQDFIAEVVACHYFVNPCGQLRQGFGFIQ